MKKVICIVKPFLAETVCRSLAEITGSDVLASEVRGYGRQKGHLEKYQPGRYKIAFLPKVRLETFVRDDQLSEVVDKIQATARTGRLGDGKIFVLDAADPQLGL